jgi:hypothetical protein
MTEADGPFYYDCPLSLIRLADPPANANAETWRHEVHAWHERKRKLKMAFSNLKPGDPITHTGKTYLLSSRLGGQLGWLVKDDKGQPWRMSPKTVADALGDVT